MFLEISKCYKIKPSLNILQIGAENKVSIVCNKLLLIPIYCEDVLTAGPLSSLASLLDDSNVFMLNVSGPITLNSLHHISERRKFHSLSPIVNCIRAEKLPCPALPLIGQPAPVLASDWLILSLSDPVTRHLSSGSGLPYQGGDQK